MRLVAQPHCPVCSGAGEMLHEALVDRLFGATGEWRLLACRDDGCGAAWLDPAPHPDDLWQAYREYYTHADDGPRLRVAGSRGEQAWAAARLGYPRPAKGGTVAALLLRPRRRRRALATRLHLPWVAGGRFLDIGCGAGRQLRTMQALGWTVQGIEPDAAAVATARAAGLDVLHGDLLSAAIPSASFHAASMLHVIEHVVDPAAHLAAARELLRPGGRLVVATPNLAALGHHRFGADWRGLEPPRHLQLYTPQALGRSLADAGFLVERLLTRADGAARMLRISAQLRRARLRGLPRATERGNRLADLRWRLLGMLEGLLVASGRPCGEELFVIARKPG